MLQVPGGSSNSYKLLPASTSASSSWLYSSFKPSHVLRLLICSGLVLGPIVVFLLPTPPEPSTVTPVLYSEVLPPSDSPLPPLPPLAAPLGEPCAGVGLRRQQDQTPFTSASGAEWSWPTEALPLTATLEERLDAWSSSPLSSHEDWTAYSNLTCGGDTTVGNWNKLHVRENEEKWREMGEADVGRLRGEMVGYLREKYMAGGMVVDEAQKGRRGILFTAGNADTFERVIVSLRLIRSYGTTLPAEVFHFPGEEPTSAQIFEYDKLGAVVRTVEGIKKDDPHQKAFHIKGAALYQCSFEEFLYLDSDSMPAKDVTVLFDSPGYVELGAFFWPDYWKDSADNAIWSILGTQCRDEWTQEAGQMLINKSMHLDVLHLVSYMLSEDNHKFWFTLSDGDKDLFRYAFLALRKRWAVPGRHLAAASWKEPDNLKIRPPEFCGHTMLQFDAEGEAAFVHGNLLKRFMPRFGLGTTWGSTSQLVWGLSDEQAEESISAKEAVTADHLANADSFGIGILAARSPATRARAELKLTYWEDDPVLKGFEQLFYDSKGVPNGAGFRRRKRGVVRLGS